MAVGQKLTTKGSARKGDVVLHEFEKTDNLFWSNDDLGLGGLFPRSFSMDVTNDPRVFGDNVILHRLVAFNTISSCAIFMAQLAAKQALTMTKTHYIYEINYICFVLFVLCFVVDLFVMLGLTTMAFHAARLATAGPMGFELAKSYYLNPYVVTMRHIAANSFLFFIPILIMGISGATFVKLGCGKTWTSWPIPILLMVSALALYVVIWKTSKVFAERYNLVRRHTAPLAEYLIETDHYSTRLAAAELDLPWDG